MGYFSNGTEGDIYEARYCARCVHRGRPDGPDCAVWDAHLLHNGDRPQDEVLHLLIPREGIFNGKCKMFIEEKA